MFVAVDRTHAVRSVTHSHDASGARTRRFGDSLPSHPEAVLPRAAGPEQDSLPEGRTGFLSGRGNKATVTGRISDLSLALLGGITGANHIFRSTGTGPRSGWEDASRNTATFAVSREHRAGQVRSGLLKRTGTRPRSGWEDASRNTATFAVSREHRAGQPLPKKIMPGVDIVPTRQGS